MSNPSVGATSLVGVDLSGAQLNWKLRICLAVSTGLLLALSSLYPSLFVLTWFAFVPLLIALRGLNARAAYGVGMLAGLALFGLSSHWMADFLQLLQSDKPLWFVSFAILYWFYSAQLVAVIAALTVLLSRRFQVLWVFPLVVTVVFAGFPTLFSVQVGETQSLFLAALQGSAIAGVYGLDFVIALVNVLLAMALMGETVLGQTRGQASRYELFRGPPLAYLLVFGWFAYGITSLENWEAKVEQWDTVTVGMVQPHEPPGVGEPQPPPAYSRAYSLPMALSEQLAEQSVDVIVWPELRLQHYFALPHVQESFHRHVKQWQIPLIFQDMDRVWREGAREGYNSSVFINAEGELSGRYDKVKRIPLAEYLPWFQEWPAANDFIRELLGNFYSGLSAGAGPAVFTIDGASLIPLICYEVMFPQLVANAVADDVNAPVLLGQSNNGWFGNTQQPYQHLHASVLRSVENRVPLVHVVNNGPSAVVLPSGRFQFRSDYRQGAAYAVDVPVSSEPGGSFYSRHPGLFISLCYLLLASMLLSMLLWRWMPRSWRNRIAANIPLS